MRLGCMSNINTGAYLRNELVCITIQGGGCHDTALQGCHVITLGTLAVHTSAKTLKYQTNNHLITFSLLPKAAF